MVAVDVSVSLTVAAHVAAASVLATYAEFAAAGALITITCEGLTSPRVDLQAPKHLAGALLEALDWRIAAMRAQVQTRDGNQRTLVARTAGVTAAQRPEPGVCLSCGEDHAERCDTGDCALCNAARIAALRAEALLPLPAVRVASVSPSVEEWRASLYAAIVRPDPLPAPAPRPTWTCSKCGALVTGQRDRDDECGPCELRRISVCDMSMLGGAR